MKRTFAILRTIIVIDAAVAGACAPGTALPADVVASMESAPPIERKVWLVAQNDQLARRQLPLLGALTESEARERLKIGGFTGKVSAYVTSTTTKCPSGHQSLMPGRVCASKPNYRDQHEGKVALDAEIALLIQGERSVDEPYGIPPKVIGMSRDEAVKALAEQRFSSVDYRFVEDTTCPARKVCGLEQDSSHQRPDGTWDASSAANRASPVLLRVGTAHPRGANRLNAPMINIVGDTLDRALDKLDEFGVRGEILKSKRPCPSEATGIGGGRICEQRPPAGQGTSGIRVEYAIAESLPSPRPADESSFSSDPAQRKEQ